MKDCTCAIREPRTCPRHRHLYDPLYHFSDGGDLVPGYWESPDGQADARDQRKWDQR